MNHVKIPKVNAMALRKIFCLLWPACWMKPKNFSEITGNTHGIKFKMMPPTKPNSRNVRIPRAGAGRATERTGDVVICHDARSSPFDCCEKTTRPAIDDKFFAADSSGMRNTMSLLLRD